MNTLPDCEETKVFDFVVKTLKSDPALAGFVKTWRTWEKDTKSDDPPTINPGPWVRLTARPADATWSAVGPRANAPMIIEIETATPYASGRRVQMNLWGAIRKALWPKSPAVYEKFRQAGTWQWNFVKASYAPQIDKDIWWGLGEIRFEITHEEK